MIANNRKVGLHCCITCSKLLFKCFKWRCEKKYKHESIRKCMNIKVTKYYVCNWWSYCPTITRKMVMYKKWREETCIIIEVSLPLRRTSCTALSTNYWLYSQFVILLAQACFLQSLCHSIFHIGITVLN